MIRARQALGSGRPGFAHEFAYLMVDGSTLREDALMAVVGHGLWPVTLFGGSAGDGARFGQSHWAQGGAVRTNAAFLSFLRARCPVKVFSFDHLDAGPGQMVVTGAYLIFFSAIDEGVVLTLATSRDVAGRWTLTWLA